MTEEESMDQFVWNDLWQIMKRAKVDSLCCLGYPDRVRKCKRFLTLCVVVILILGCFVYFIKPEYTLFGSIVSAIIEILKEYTGKTGADWDSAPEQTGTLLMRQS